MFEPIEVPYAPCQIDAQLIRRFWSKVQIGDDAACWPWNAHLDRLGYGSFWVGNSPARAHRMAWLLWNGEAFPPDVKLRHTCDNRRCCNPGHMLPGSQNDNMKDRKAREGYRTIRRGEQHPMAKLTVEAVKDIRSGHESLRASAARHGISPATVSRVRRGLLWAWLAEAA